MEPIVFKFGGASVKDATAVANVARILSDYKQEELLVVISAMGKTTNLLEALAKAAFHCQSDRSNFMDQVRDFHQNITKELVGDTGQSYYEVDNLLIELECLTETPPEHGDFDMFYDQVICFGELISTRIISHYLNTCGITNRWLDARNFIITQGNYRQASVRWNITEDLIQTKLKPILKKQLVITQGFIGRNEQQLTTTLGREGSDYSAAIFAYGLDAQSVTIWKDVPGVMNADPKRLAEAEFLPKVSYSEAIELAYYGATVIHPKTIQPLQSKQIPLYVRSFVDHKATGTVIEASNQKQVIGIPCYIFKDNQVLIRLSSKDFSFIIEDHLSHIFSELARDKIQVNLMQHSAISFSFCANHDPQAVSKLLKRLESDYDIHATEGLQLVTIFGYKSAENDPTRVLGQRQILLEQISDRAIQLVVPE